MNIDNQAHPICIFFLRTTAQAENLKQHIDSLTGNSICTINHTIVYALPDTKAQAESLFHDISRSLDIFNLNFVTTNTDHKWLSQYQTERSLGIFMMKLTETNDIQATLNEFRIQSIVRLETQVDAYSVNTQLPSSIASLMLNKAGLGFALSLGDMEKALKKAEFAMHGFDFIDYSQLFEDVIRPLAMRALDQDDMSEYHNRMSEILSRSQDSGATAMIFKGIIFKMFAETLTKNTSLSSTEVPELAMTLTKTFFMFKSLFATQALSEQYEVISNKPMLSIHAILKPIATHKKSLSPILLAKTA